MKPTLWDKVSDFVLGKGFYIVLFLCAATIGISGYYLLNTAQPDMDTTPEPVTGNPSIVLPDESDPAPVKEKTPAKAPSSSVPPQKQTKPAPAQTPAPAVLPQHSPGAAASVKKAAVFTWPVKGELLRDYTAETLAYDPTMGDWRTHTGLDIGAGEGWKVLCVSDGTVLEVKQDEMMGTTVAVDHGEGLVSVYANLAPEVLVKVGQAVQTGTEVGTVGHTAMAESAQPSHLHLEMHKDGKSVDPREFLGEKK